MADRATAAHRPLWWGITLILAGWALLIIPMFWALVLAAAGFSGCFIECSQPDPAVGMVGATAVAIMAAAPVLAGIALIRRSRTWWIATGCLCAAILLPLAYARITGAA
jgi:hypothetical protein